MEGGSDGDGDEMITKEREWFDAFKVCFWTFINPAIFLTSSMKAAKNWKETLPWPFNQPHDHQLTLSFCSIYTIFFDKHQGGPRVKFARCSCQLFGINGLIVKIKWQKLFSAARLWEVFRLIVKLFASFFKLEKEPFLPAMFWSEFSYYSSPCSTLSR